jgi:hypothetical protein
LPVSPFEADSRLFGGNLEATPPSGRRALGGRFRGGPGAEDASSASTQGELFQKLGTFLERGETQPLDTFDVGWLRSGHVDELFVFLPGEGPAADACLLLVASPGRALRLLDPHRTEKITPTKASGYYAHLAAGVDVDEVTWGHLLASDVNTNGANSIEAYNRDIDLRLFGDRGESQPETYGGILGELLDSMGDPNARRTRVVEVPILFVQSSAQDGEVKAKSIFPNMVNLLATGQCLLVPDPCTTCFRQAMLDGLSPRTADPCDGRPIDPAPYTVTWLDEGLTLWLHGCGGWIHCSTVVYRTPLEGKTWWSEE